MLPFPKANAFNKLLILKENYMIYLFITTIYDVHIGPTKGGKPQQKGENRDFLLPAKDVTKRIVAAGWESK